VTVFHITCLRGIVRSLIAGGLGGERFDVFAPFLQLREDMDSIIW
jgi:hypothetical protein